MNCVSMPDLNYTQQHTKLNKMKKPKVALKNIVTHNGEDGLGFNADLFINGLKCFHVLDDGNGYDSNGYNFTILTHNNPKANLINKAIDDLHAYVDSMPKLPFMAFGEQQVDELGEPMYITNTVEMLVHELFKEFVIARDTKKFEQVCKKSICFGIPNGYQYQMISCNKPLAEVPVKILQSYIDQIKKLHMKPDDVILNKNLTALGVTI